MIFDICFASGCCDITSFLWPVSALSYLIFLVVLATVHFHILMRDLLYKSIIFLLAYFSQDGNISLWKYKPSKFITLWKGHSRKYLRTHHTIQIFLGQHLLIFFFFFEKLLGSNYVWSFFLNLKMWQLRSYTKEHRLHLFNIVATNISAWYYCLKSH